MANEEHVKRLLDGVAGWNQWRDENPTIRPDLSGVRFFGKNSLGLGSSADLTCADLTGVILNRTTFHDCDFFETKFTPRPMASRSSEIAGSCMPT